MAVVQLLAGERQGGESSRAVQACNDYLRMGPGRSLRKLAQKYSRTKRNQAPTESEGTLFEWSTTFAWQERAAAYDTELDLQRTERKRKEFETGLALDFERIHKLKRLALFLERQIYEEEDPAAVIVVGEGAREVAVSASPFPNVWVRDVKAVANQRVDVFRFNAAILEQFRGVLDDLARETGGRRQKTDHSGLIASIDLSKLSTEQVERIAAGEDVMQVILSGYVQRSADPGESGT